MCSSLGLPLSKSGQVWLKADWISAFPQMTNVVQPVCGAIVMMESVRLSRLQTSMSGRDPTIVRGQDVHKHAARHVRFSMR